MADEIVNPEVIVEEPKNEEVVVDPNAEAIVDDAKVDDKKAEDGIKKEDQPVSTKHKFKYKVNDKEIEEELEIDEVQRRLQKVYGIELKAQEAANLRKQSEEFLNLIKSGDFSFLDKLGVNGKESVSNWLVQQMLAEEEEKNMTPEKRELLKTQKELETLRQTKKAEEDAEQEALSKELELKYSTQIEKDIIEAATTNGLPASKVVIQRTAYYMKRAYENGTKLTPTDVMPIVKKEMEDYLSAFFNTSDMDNVFRILGPNLEKIRKADLDKLKAKSLPGSKAPVTAKKKEETKTRKELLAERKAEQLKYEADE